MQLLTWTNFFHWLLIEIELRAVRGEAEEGKLGEPERPWEAEDASNGHNS